MNRLILFISLIFFTQNSFAQTKEDYLIEYLNVSNGLSNNSVTRVVKDNLGQLWFGSSEGIVKLDAQGFEYLKPSKRYNQFYSEDIETLTLGHDNILWVGTKSGGLSSYNIAKDQFVSYNHLFESYIKENTFLRVTALAETQSGLLCIGTWANGFFVIDPKSKKIVFHQKQKRVIQTIQEIKKGNIWYASAGSLFEFKEEENKSIRHPIQGLNWISKIIFDSSRNAFYFGVPKGIYVYDISKKKTEKLIVKNQGKIRLINSIISDKQGRLWVGTWKNGLFRSNSEKTEFKKIDLLPENEINKNYEGITDIFIDDNGVIWITTTHGGVVKLIENRGIYKIANTLKQNIGFSDNNINSLYVDSKGNQWIGTKNGGLNYKKAKDKTYRKVKSAQNIVISFFKEIKGEMYVATSKGLFIFPLDNPNAKHQFFGSTKFRKLKSIYFDEEKHKIWFGLQQSGLAVVDSEKALNIDQIHYFSPEEKKSNYFTADRVEHIIKGKNNHLWIGTFQGLYNWDTDSNTGEFIDLKTQFDFPSNIILSIKTTPQQDTLFVGSANGLLVLDNTTDELKKIAFYDKKSGLENKCINAIILDDHQNVWLGLSKGISSLNLKTGAINNFTKEDGVNVSSINLDAVYYHKDLIYFGGQKGMLVFSPEFISAQKTTPNAYFSKMFVDNKYIQVGDSLNHKIVLDNILPFTKEVQLSYKDKVIRLDINTTDYIDQKNINFYYRVSTISEQWIENQHASSITLTQLPAGENIIEIKACKAGECGIINQLIINVSPSPWKTTTAYIIYLSIFLLLLFGVFSFFIRKEKLENKVRLANLEKEKEHEITEAKVRFFTNISHEIRTPLTLIHSPLEELLDEKDLPQKYKSKLKIINKNASGLLVLVNQLLDFRKIENNKITLSYQYVSLKKLIENKCWEFKALVQSSGLQLHFNTEISDQQLYKLDQEKIEIVINNLISNAIKFTPNGKNIWIKLEVDKKIKIQVKDEGVGIPKKDIKSIFQRYYQGEKKTAHEQKGTGIGLSLSQNIVELHSGTIAVESTEGKGSTFTIELPIIESVMEMTTSEVHFNEEEKNTLLLVDDNLDILEYLESIFQDQYHILKSVNGQEALEVLEKEKVDIIISDVMMPVMDGLTFCKEVKQKPELSSIPLLLLTANATTENELQGLEFGANDFLRKPFVSKVIKEKVRNLLAYKQQLLDFYQSQLIPKGKELPKSEKVEVIEKPLTEDQLLIQKAVQYIEENIDNDDLNVEQLASHMCMSQSTLYRKIKALTNKTIVAFIRSVRLKRAAQMILDTNYSLKEIAENVGINDSRYFKREFKKQYGVEPDEYKEQAVV